MSFTVDAPIDDQNSMNIDELQRDPLQDADDDLYLSDSDVEFADAVSEVPASLDEDIRKNETVCEHSEGSSSFDLIDPSSSVSPSGFKPSQANVTSEQSLDLAENIRGLYRILDLISERGSGGLVDKVIIDQESTGRFINEIRPGAYKDLTKVDFKALDEVDVKPVGIYGSKSEIVRFLGEQEVLDSETAHLLMVPHSEDVASVSPSLRPGLYALLVPGNAASDRRVFVIFWPEETSWDDNAISSVRRNRITFVRYLTKITDQIVVLISDEHGRALVWDDPEDVDDSNASFFDLEEDTDRLFPFEVAKVNEQEENVSLDEGIKFKSPLIAGGIASSKPCSEIEPYIIGGDTKQALLTSEFIPSRDISDYFNDVLPNRMQIKARFFGKESSLRLGVDISQSAIALLIQSGMDERYPDPVSEYKARERESEERVRVERLSKTESSKRDIEASKTRLADALRTHLVNLVLGSYPKLDETLLRGRVGGQECTKEQSEAFLQSLFALYPTLQQKLAELAPRSNFSTIRSEDRGVAKALRKVIICDYLFSHNHLSVEEQKTVWSLVDVGVESGDMKGAERFLKDDDPSGLSGIVRGLSKFGRNILTVGTFSSQPEGPVRDAWEATRNIKSREFFDMAEDIQKRWPVLETGIREAFNVANAYFARHIADALRAIPHRLLHEQLNVCKDALERELGAYLNKERECIRSQLVVDIEMARATEESRSRIILLEKLEKETPYRFSTYERYRVSGRLCADNLTATYERYRVSGRIYAQSEPSMRYTVHPLELTEEDRQSLRMNSSFVPRPKVSVRGNFSFSLSIGTSIRLIRLLPNDQCLLVTEGNDHNLYVYMGNADNLGTAVTNARSMKIINREKTGKDVILAYGEGKRTLVVCGVDAQKPLVQVYYFAFDERYQTLSAQGSAVNLTAWYASDLPKITDVLIVGDGDELALVEDNGKVRIFSNVTQQFRPAHLQLPSAPLTTFSTPDGSCFAAVFLRSEEPVLAMHHWASLGSHQGFTFTLPKSFAPQPIISALDDRKHVHLFALDFESSTCRSIRINITRPTTEFIFCEKHTHSSSSPEERRTKHNSLIDCHSDVWTRFPVLPAVQRQTILSKERRKAKSIRFVTASRTRVPFEDYFKEMIQKFEKSTKKPTGALLSDIAILVCGSAYDLDPEAVWQDASVYKAGEWIVDIFCLIPIHIAIARDNRFIPLKDGVWAPEVEKSLLGADVGRVADTLSFGWYESIFQSYMSTKNVKVVSSMGEQSVGKSYALNHLADTSFAGSAMRTTEGVWMAVTPTETDLLVALDFEGVHSIERSAQEDTLLVLFNAAISNLVLFRNNFALSRDITNLFQSFQSSSSILDPEANKSLFQSTLAIIIKDVVDSDRIEIAKEFKLKLQKIVQEEQGANFITRLYRGRLDIIPWPVIESRQFYTLFTALGRRLANQGSTHEGGGAFLHKLKMLMAKLKTNDWGSLSQNMATHRAQHLLSLLPRAMSFGAMEQEPDIEPLKNFDTNDVVENDDSESVFCVNQPGESQKDAVRRLINDWPDSGKRHQLLESKWMDNLCSYLQELVDKRIAHVQAWIDSNLTHFNGSNAAIENLRRALDAGAVEIKRSVQLCRAKCLHCHLLCLGVQFHEDAHDCFTDHRCPIPCQFADEHGEEPEPCSLPAGHEGPHMCDPAAHLCGQPCDLNERKGCLGSCTKTAGHSEPEHMCSTRRHLCGEPCDLHDVNTPGSKPYTCQGTCFASWDEEHDSHVCSATSCPITCQLCKRLCASTDHLHGLHADAVHLCGQEHRCKEECSSKGVCEIDTVPQSIEATFSGAHDRFQYTKYSQKTKRLPCAITIGPGLLTHDGPHIHSTSGRIFHFCDARCANCDYVCTLPFEHPQPEHSTNHGSMSRTRWVVDGNSLELDGHKFGSNDDGAPMLCNLVCSAMGRHAHIDYCRASDPNSCNTSETDHIKTRIEPNPNRPKDWISHGLYWRRLGFRDPYSREEQATFAKCDAMCSGPEHRATANNAAQPSYCALPIFHPRAVLNQAPAGGHVSDDGHAFVCKNPAVLTQAFHVIFVIDRSSSMSSQDRRPLANYPASARIIRTANNRLGAVYSALHSFWLARATAMNQAGVQTRRDAYSAILFESSATEVFANDFGSSPDTLLDRVLRYSSAGGTNFSAAISMSEQIMTRHWSTERAPVVIFLSDGECSIGDDVMYSLCRKAVSLGRSLSFQAVSFGPDCSSMWLRRMVQIAKEVQDRAPRDPLLPANAVVESSYSIALDSVRLAETFLGIAESLRKTRGGLIR